MGAPKRGRETKRAKPPAKASGRKPAKKTAPKKAAAAPKKRASRAPARATKKGPKSAAAPKRAAPKRAAPKRTRAAAKRTRAPRGTLEVAPLTLDCFADLERLFGPNGACGGCWCMYPRTSKADYEAGKGEPNRAALRTLAATGPAPGLLGYVNDEPVAWCSLAPRQALVRLATSRILAPVDEQPVWSIVCLFVAKSERRKGLSAAMVEAAVEYAELHGARIVEAYPVEPKGGTVPAAFAWWGLSGAYLAAGFEEVARRSESRPILRRTLA